MKTLMRFAASLLLVAFFFGLSIPPGSRFSLAASPRNQKERQTKVRNIKAKRGQEVASRVKKLRQGNKNVRAALRLFENRGRMPKIEAAESVSGTISSTDVASKQSRKNLSAFQKIAFAPQSETIEGEGYELTIIPTLDIDGEWQGTFIATKYDEYGNQLDQRVYNVVLVGNTENNQTCIFEVEYEGGVGYLNWEPGMIDDQNFQWGTSLVDQPVPNREYQGPASESGPQMPEQPVSRLRGTTFMHASFLPSQPQDLGFRYRDGPHYAPPQIRNYVGTVLLGVGAAAASCRIFPGVISVACVASRAAMVAIMNLPRLFR